MANLDAASPADTGISPETGNVPAGPGEIEGFPPRKHARYSLFVITVVVFFTVIDRQILALMIEPMKRDFNISDTEAALLLGAAFSITYGIAGIPIAKLADRANRRNLIAISIVFWSVCTMACGIAQNYTMMFLARLGIGIGESGYGPAAWSIANDNWPREKVAFATGIMGLGAMAGVASALFGGGLILALVADWPTYYLPGGGIIRPWQWAFIIVGLPGVVWGLIVLTTREPPRRASPGTKKKGADFNEVVRWILADWRTYAATLGGATMKGMILSGTTAWNATMLHREFGWSLSKVGLITGGVSLIVSPLGMLAGGKLSERWAKAGRDDANLRIVFYGLLFTVPVSTIAPLMPNPYLVIALNATVTFITMLGFGPAAAASQVVTPGRMRAQVGALSQFGTNVIAFALAPLVVALFTDFVFNSEKALKYSMACNVAVMGSITLLITFQGLKPYARSYRRAVEQNF